MRTPSGGSPPPERATLQFPSKMGTPQKGIGSKVMSSDAKSMRTRIGGENEILVVEDFE